MPGAGLRVAARSGEAWIGGIRTPFFVERPGALRVDMRLRVSAPLRGAGRGVPMPRDEGVAQNALAADAEWDAADMGCGPLVLELRKRLRAMPGRVLKVAARDPGAALDLPAWCRLTANELLHHDTDSRCFWIR